MTATFLLLLLARENMQTDVLTLYERGGTVKNQSNVYKPRNVFLMWFCVVGTQLYPANQKRWKLMSRDWTQPIRRGESCHVTIQYSNGTNGEGDFSGHVYCLFNTSFYLSFVHKYRIPIIKRGENLCHVIEPNLSEEVQIVMSQFSTPMGPMVMAAFSGNVYCLFNSIFYFSFAHAYRIPII